MLVCGSSISQTVTKKEQNSVVIDTAIARLIANDLVSGDVCKEELQLVKGNLFLTEGKVKYKDSIIGGLEVQKKDLHLIISKKDDIISNQEKISNVYKESLAKEKKRSFFYKALSFLGVLTTSILLLKA